jgi:hypothetical protein
MNVKDDHIQSKNSNLAE